MNETMNTVTVMTVDRRLVTVPEPLLSRLCPHHVKATNGVYVPACDLAQYEAGNRPAVTDETGLNLVRG